METNYNASMVVRRYVGCLPENLLINSRSTDPDYETDVQRINTILPGGGYKDGDQSPWHTAKRELYEETGLRVRPGVLPKLVHRYNASGRLHVKYYFAVSLSDCMGVLRQRAIWDGPNTRLSRPIWVYEAAAVHKALGQHGVAIWNNAEGVILPFDRISPDLRLVKCG